LATLRTVDPQHHYLRLFFAPDMADEVEALVESVAAQFTIQRLPDQF
jgi:hypothetical protein